MAHLPHCLGVVPSGALPGQLQFQNNELRPLPGPPTVPLNLPCLGCCVAFLVRDRHYTADAVAAGTPVPPGVPPFFVHFIPGGGARAFLTEVIAQEHRPPARHPQLSTTAPVPAGYAYQTAAVNRGRSYHFFAPAGLAATIGVGVMAAARLEKISMQSVNAPTLARARCWTSVVNATLFELWRQRGGLPSMAGRICFIAIAAAPGYAPGPAPFLDPLAIAVKAHGDSLATKPAPAVPTSPTKTEASSERKDAKVTVPASPAKPELAAAAAPSAKKDPGETKDAKSAKPDVHVDACDCRFGCTSTHHANDNCGCQVALDKDEDELQPCTGLRRLYDVDYHHDLDEATYALILEAVKDPFGSDSLGGFASHADNWLSLHEQKMDPESVLRRMQDDHGLIDELEAYVSDLSHALQHAGVAVPAPWGGAASRVRLPDLTGVISALAAVNLSATKPG